MNDTFVWSRFVLLIKKHYSQNRRFYIGNLGMLFAIFACLYWFFWAAQTRIETIIPLLFITSLAGISQHLNYTMRDYSDRQRCITSLCLPASSVEQYVFIWFNSLVVFLVAFFSVFMLNNTLMHFILDYSMPWETVCSVFFDPQKIIILLIVHATVLFSLFLPWMRPFGGMILAGGFAVIMLISTMLLHRIGWIDFASYDAPVPMVLYYSISNNEHTTLAYTLTVFQGTLQEVVRLGLTYSYPITLWIISFFLFKEQQVK